jgi:hypothetical protein
MKQAAIGNDMTHLPSVKRSTFINMLTSSSAKQANPLSRPLERNESPIKKLPSGLTKANSYSKSVDFTGGVASPADKFRPLSPANSRLRIINTANPREATEMADDSELGKKPPKFQV